MSDYEKARKLRAVGKSRKALDSLKRAVSDNPDHIEARFELATLLDESGETQKALAEYMEVVKRHPRWATAHHNLGWTYAFQLGELTKGLKHLEKAVKLAPTDANHWYALGCIYQSAQITDKAIEAFKRSIANTPETYIREDATRRLKRLSSHTKTSTSRRLLL